MKIFHSYPHYIWNCRTVHWYRSTHFSVFFSPILPRNTYNMHLIRFNNNNVYNHTFPIYVLKVNSSIYFQSKYVRMALYHTHQCILFCLHKSRIWLQIFQDLNVVGSRCKSLNLGPSEYTMLAAYHERWQCFTEGVEQRLTEYTIIAAYLNGGSAFSKVNNRNLRST